MMNDAQITVGELSSFLLYAAFVGVSIGGECSIEDFIFYECFSFYEFPEEQRSTLILFHAFICRS